MPPSLLPHGTVLGPGDGSNYRQPYLRHYSRAPFQRAVHRALGSNFGELVGHRSINATLDADHSFEAIDLAGLALGSFTAVLAVLGRQLAMLDADRNAAKSQVL